MKTFDQLKKEVKLTRFFGDESGVRYIISDFPEDKKIVIRHLDGKFTLDLLPVYVDLYNAIMQSINCNCNVSECVYMPNLVEVGKDYFIRSFYVYYVSTRRYYDEDEPITPPDEYPILIEALSKELSKYDVHTDIVYRVLKRSLLEPSGKTIVDNIWKKLIIVEPKITIDDLEEWRASSASSSKAR